MLSRRQLMNDKIVSEQVNEPTILDKCKGSYFNGMNVYGHSTQVTTTGAQLIPDRKYSKEFVASGITFKCLQDGSVTIDGTNNSSTDVFLALFNNTDGNILSNGTYYLSGNVKNSNVILQFWQSNKASIKDFGEGAIINFVDEGQTYNVAMVVKSGITLNNVRIYPMLNKGDKPLPFEPYTGGKPSPSPEYPQPINNVGGSNNLFPILEENFITTDGLKSVINSDGSITITGTPTKQSAKATKNIPLNLPVGKYYINGGETDVGNILFQLRITYNDGTSNNYPNRGVFWVTDKVASVEGFLVYTSKNLQPVNYTIYPMLNKGDKPLPFEKYVDSIDVNVNGGNLFPILEKNLVSDYGLKGVINSDGSVTITGTPTRQYAIVYLLKLNLPFGNYYLKGGGNHAGEVATQIRFKNKGLQEYHNGANGSMVVIDENISDIELLLYYSASDLQPVNYTIYPMLNVGSTTLPFEPYKPK